MIDEQLDFTGRANIVYTLEQQLRNRSYYDVTRATTRLVEAMPSVVLSYNGKYVQTDMTLQGALPRFMQSRSWHDRTRFAHRAKYVKVMELK